MFFTRLTILSSFTNAIPLSAVPLNTTRLSAIPLSCISMNNQSCKARPEVFNVNSNNPIFYPFSVRTSKCSGNCNNINAPYAKICVNETKNIKCYETCKCEWRLNAIVCNNKQHWNKDKCTLECKELIHKGVCDKDFIWNPSNCECECNKACDFSEYLDYKNCTCKKRLVDKLVEECNEAIDEEAEIIDNNKNKCNSCIVHIVLFSVFFLINVGIGAYFAYDKYVNCNKKMILDMIVFIINTKWE